MKFTKNEDAVSPVIGVILMVAITVILAAVIAAFVFGMAGNIQKTKVVSATAQQQGNAIIITYNGGQDAATVSALTVNITNSTGSTVICPSATCGVLGTTVGSYVTSPNGYGSPGQDKIVVTAAFTDGSSQIILDTTV